MTTPLDARLDAFAAAIAAAREIAVAGGLLDLSGLDRAAATMCEAVVALPPAVRRQTAERLVAIGNELDELAAVLRASPAPLPEGPGSRSARAGRAYRTPPARPRRASGLGGDAPDDPTNSDSEI